MQVEAQLLLSYLKHYYPVNMIEIHCWLLATRLCDGGEKYFTTTSIERCIHNFEGCAHKAYDSLYSEKCRLEKLLTSENIGDRRPTQLVRHMQQLLSDRHATFEQSLLCEFLQRLPPHV